MALTAVQVWLLHNSVAEHEHACSCTCKICVVDSGAILCGGDHDRVVLVSVQHNVHVDIHVSWHADCHLTYSHSTNWFGILLIQVPTRETPGMWCVPGQGFGVSCQEKWRSQDNK